MKTRLRLILILSLVLLLTITACKAPASQPEAKPAEEGTATEAPVAEEPAEISNLNLEGYPIVNEKITLKALQWELDNQDIDFANLWFYQQLEEKTNIHVDFEEVKVPDFKTKLNLMFASGDYSDIIIRGVELAEVEEYGVTQGLLVALDDYLPTYMPNYYERLQMNDSNAAIPSSDGKSYYVGFLIAQNVNHVGTWYINTTWLDNLDLEIPTTIDQLTEVLRAFKTGDPNGNGKADEVPMQAEISNTNHDMTLNLMNMFASFGVPENTYYMFIDENEKVQFTGLEPGWRDCLEWLNVLYSEGLLDPEALTQDSNLWGTKMNSDISGFTTYLRLIATALQEDIYKNFKSILPPVAEGYEAKVSAILELPDFGAAITVANENVEATLRWLDAQMETETMMIAANGPFNEGGPIEPTMVINEAGQYHINYVPENNGLYEIVPVICGQFFAPGDYYTEIYEMPPHRLERYLDSKWYAEENVLEYKSFHYLTKLSKMSNEDATEVNKLFIDIDSFMRESMTNFITQGVTDDSYNDFLATLEGLQVSRYLELYQNAYDQYLSK